MKISIFIVDRNIKISKESYLFLFLGPVLRRIRMRMKISIFIGGAV
jgi:hypothetical protein